MKLEGKGGLRLGARWTPVERAACYVPGGIASYPSSVLMNAIPARVAGVERLVLALTNEGDLVIDPFMGVGSAAVAAVMHKRRAAGADTLARYVEIAKERVKLAGKGKLPTRPMDRPIYEPPANSGLVRRTGGRRKRRAT